MNRDRRLRERLDRIAGPVDRQGVWVGIEARAAEGGAVPTEKGPSATRLAEPRLRSRRVPLAIGAAAILVVAVGVVVAATLGAGRGQAAFGVDNGQGGHWEKLPAAIEGGDIRWLTIDPQDSSWLFVTTEDGVFRSADKAGSWERVLSFGKGAYGLILDPASPSTVYVRMRSSFGPSSTGEPVVRMWRSDDRGDSWTELTAGYVEAARAEYPERVEKLWDCSIIRMDDGTEPTTVYLRIDLPDPNGGDGSTYWRSTDRGVTWTELQGEEREQFVYGLTFDPPVEDSEYQLESPQLTDAAGQSLGSARFAKVDPNDPGTIYALGDDGLCKSTDGGATWAPAASGIVHDIRGTLVVDPESPSVLYAVATEGVYKSNDAGDTWGLILPAGFLGEGGQERHCSFALSSSDPSTLYARTSDGILRSEDGGQEWEGRAGSGLMDADPDNDSQTLLLASSADPEIVFATAYADLSTALYRSVDGGDTWANVLEKYFQGSLVADPSDASAFYAITGAEEPGIKSVVRSVDDGATWQTIASSEPGVAQFGLALGEGDPATIFSWSLLDGHIFNDYGRESVDVAALGQSMSRSLDGGSSWENVEFEGLPGPVAQMTADPRVPGTWYALSFRWGEERWTEVGVYGSGDGGKTWTPVFGDPPLHTYDLIMGPGQDGPLYACGYLGFYRWVPAD